jgi:hypothetical protein
VKERKAKKARKGRWQIHGKSEWAAALPSQRYFLSLFWKRFRHGFSLQLRRQASHTMAFLGQVRTAQLDVHEAERLMVGA